jgi:hypothetical protein
LSSHKLSKNFIIKIHKTINLVALLLGCETWSLTSREECRLKIFKSRAMRKISGPKRDEIIGRWRKLHDEELRNLYPLPNIYN